MTYNTKDTYTRYRILAKPSKLGILLILGLICLLVYAQTKKQPHQPGHKVHLWCCDAAVLALTFTNPAINALPLALAGSDGKSLLSCARV